MKPKAQNENEVGLLEYLEDIIGSQKYVENIEKLEKDIERLEDERREKLSRVKACEHELESLTSDFNNAIHFLRQERNLMLLRNMSHFCDLGDGVIKLNASIAIIDERKNAARQIKDQKKTYMEKN
jgi:structural maintenance of chromosome 4